MSEPRDEFEVLLSELAPDEAQRAKLREEHRLLEHDLSRLADPLPPPDFLAQVMQRVDAEAVAAAPRRELFRALAIFVPVLTAGLGLWVFEGGPAAAGVSFAGALLWLRQTGLGALGALDAVWKTAALPVAVALSAALSVGLWALKRVAVSSVEEVSS